MTGDTDARPDFDALWNYGDPAGTEAKFRELLPVEATPGNAEWRAELMTQIARTLGLQQEFDEAHALLDSVEAALTPGMKAARTRYLLERGRVINSAGDPEGSIAVFDSALAAAEDAGLDNYAVDAAHMLGIVTKGDDSIAWNLRAMEMAEASSDPKARRWRGSLSNNLGWTYFDLRRWDEALAMFEKHRIIRAEQGDSAQAAIARWSIAKTYRMMGRPDEALAIQRELAADQDRAGTSDGYIHEELGECLLALGREEEARPEFARAWELLHTDPWLARDEAERLERMKRLGRVIEEAKD